MDELFDNILENKSNDNPDNTDVHAPEESVTESNQATVSEEQAPVTETKETLAEPQAPVMNTAPQQPVNPVPQAYNSAYNTTPKAYNNAYNTTYNGAYNNQPYDSANSGQNPYNTTPYGTMPTGTTQPQNFNQPAPKKKKSKVGKVVFVALICLSIIVASVAIGFDLSDDNNGTQNNPDTPATTKDTSSDFDIDGANPVIEDSPISYSEYSGKGTMTPEQIYKEIKEINVGILVYAKNQMVGEGSGIVVGSDSTGKYTYILTAAHVISDSGVNVQVQFSDESEYEATIVGIDTKTDVGVLKIEGTGFKSATFGNSDKLAVGQTVYAIGNPGGTEFFGSFTSGMISAIDRPVPTTNSSYDLPCIQHNAAINPGNSGGALVNEYGQVIGLNSSKISSTEYEGMGFSVPSETVLDVYGKIIKYGYVTNRPKLGINYFPVSSDYTYSAIAWKSDLPYGSIVIATIDENSDIANHNIQVGDIITAVNGKDLESTDILLEAIENGKVGDKLTLTVYRLNNNGSINTSFEATVELVEDKGNTTVTEKEIETDPFSNYFPDFGY